MLLTMPTCCVRHDLADAHVLFYTNNRQLSEPKPTVEPEFFRHCIARFISGPKEALRVTAIIMAILSCSVCAGRQFREVPINWDGLASEWQLGAAERSYIDRQQSCHCVT